MPKKSYMDKSNILTEQYFKASQRLEQKLGMTQPSEQQQMQAQQMPMQAEQPPMQMEQGRGLA